MSVERIVEFNDLIVHDMRINSLGSGGRSMTENLCSVLGMDILSGHDRRHIVPQNVEFGADAVFLGKRGVTIGERVWAERNDIGSGGSDGVPAPDQLGVHRI